MTSRWPWIALFAVALAVRVAFVLVRPPVAEAVLVPLADSNDYHALAVSLLESGAFANPAGEPTAFRPPGYPAFLAAAYAVFGRGNLVAVAMVQAVLGAAGALLVAFLALRAGADRRWALAAGAVCAVYPPFVFQTPQILSEVLARFQTLLAVALLVEAMRGERRAPFALAGAAWGLAILTKSVLAGCLPFVALAVACMAQRGRRRGLAAAALFVLPAAAIVGAWTVRNAVRADACVPVSTNFPITFAQGVTRWSLYTNEWYGETHALLAAPDDFLELTQMMAYGGVEEEIAVGAQWQSDARAWIAEHPGMFATLTVRKALHFWSPSVRNTPAVRIVAFACMAPVLLAGIAGLVAMMRAGGAPRAFAVVVVAIVVPATLPYALSQPDVRYRLAVADPLLMASGAWLLGALASRRRGAPTP